MKFALHFYSKVVRLIRHPALSLFLFLIITLVAYQYFQVKIYDFPPDKSFSGNQLYNPYQQDGDWLKANFHAHSKSWMGITNGHQSGDEVVRTYQEYGYDVASLSDYHRINTSINAPENIAIPVYEHGMNINKQHHLGIGAHDVTFEDVLLWQNNHIKQFLLDRMAYNSPVVCLNHPGLRDGHSEKEIGQLSGYNCLEVLNSAHTYTSHWDAVLSNGRPVWILANDDSHDVQKENVVISWNLVHASQRTAEGVLEALKNGNTIGIRRTVSIDNLDSLRTWALRNKGDVLKSVNTHDTTVTFLFKENLPEIKLIGQSGKVVALKHNVDSITYTFSKSDTYIRVEADAGDYNVYLNPVLRFDGVTIPRNEKVAVTNLANTLMLRICIVLLYLAAIRILFPSFIRWLLYGQNSKPYPSYEQAVS